MADVGGPLLAKNRVRWRRTFYHRVWGGRLLWCSCGRGRISNPEGFCPAYDRPACHITRKSEFVLQPFREEPFGEREGKRVARDEEIISHVLPYGMGEHKDLAAALRTGVPEQPFAPVRITGD
jgi:hypothetical protein